MTGLLDRGPMMAVAVAVLCGGLGGCTTTADFSYGEYQFGPGFATERVYESRIYGDAQRGIGREACRVTVQRQVDAFGEVSFREVTACDEF